MALMPTMATRRRVLPSERSRPVVSVIVPCYNYGRFLSECVRSITSQEGVDVEVLVIDDASRDDSGEIAQSLAEADRRIHLERHNRNHGHIATYNEGLEWAAGEFTVLISADDVLTPGSLHRAVSLMDSYPEVGLVYGRAVHFLDGTPFPRPRGNIRVREVWKGREWLVNQCRLGRGSIVSPEAVMRTSIQADIGGYSRELPHSADLEMWLRAATRADVAYVHADQAWHRVHPMSMSRSQFAGLRTDLEQRRAAYERALVRAADVGPALHALAMRSLAADGLWDLLWMSSRENDDFAELMDTAELLTSIDPSIGATSDYGVLKRKLRGESRSRPGPLRRVLHRSRRTRLQYGRLWWRYLLPLPR